MNKKIMKHLGVGKEVEKVKAGLCPFCGQSPGEFRDELSKREFSISGLCQSCQDETFTEGK